MHWLDDSSSGEEDFMDEEEDIAMILMLGRCRPICDKAIFPFQDIAMILMLRKRKRPKHGGSVYGDEWAVPRT